MKILQTETGSQGNCTVIESANGGLLIIDAGIKYEKVNRAVDYQLYKAEACLITHSHADHIGHLKEFITLSGTPTYLLPETRSEAGKIASDWQLKEVAIGNRYETDSFIFIPVEMRHTNSDGTPCPCAGYLIGDKGSKEKLLWATDTQFIANQFAPLDYYCIEANYFECNDWTADLPYITVAVEHRRVQSHLSVENAIAFLRAQDLSKCKGIYLIHLSHIMTTTEKKELTQRVKSLLKERNIKAKVYI